ncbi:MAG: dihydrodipicolinate synthase family protein [Longimicrobiaceae bacterium]
MNLRGVLAPVTTPFHPATGAADPDALGHNLARWLEYPLAGVVLFGSSGEGLLLDDEERPALLAAARRALGPDRLLLAGTGAESTRRAISLAHAAAAAGADAVLVHPPAYYRPLMDHAALCDHFTAVADASPVPLILYQVPPALGGMPLDPALVGKLSRHRNLAGLKDSSGDLEGLRRFVEAAVGESFAVLAGNGSVLLDSLEAGAAGGVLAVSLLAPGECTELVRLWRAGESGPARALQAKLAAVHQGVPVRFGVPGIKAALDLLGYRGGPPRPPLFPLSDADRNQLRRVLAEAGLGER